MDTFKNLLFLHGYLLHDGDDAPAAAPPAAAPASATAGCGTAGPAAVGTTS